jgi:hypothetical protein
VLVDGYDHTCPWTGTAIGAGNLPYFYAFTSAICPLLIVSHQLLCVSARKLAAHDFQACL